MRSAARTGRRCTRGEGPAAAPPREARPARHRHQQRAPACQFADALRAADQHPRNRPPRREGHGRPRWPSHSPTVTADFDLRDVRLDPFAPLARHWAFELSGGTLAATGRVDVGADADGAGPASRGGDEPVRHLCAANADRRAPARARDPRRHHRRREAHVPPRRGGRAHPWRHVRLRGRRAAPPYRLALTHSDLTVHGFSNEHAKRRGTATLRGRFMETGSAAIDATFASGTRQPEFDMDVRLESVQLVELNDLLRATGGFDVVAGRFSFYSELAVQDGRVDGYVKPFIEGLDVYDRRQDKDKGLGGQAYEALVGCGGDRAREPDRRPGRHPGRPVGSRSRIPTRPPGRSSSASCATPSGALSRPDSRHRRPRAEGDCENAPHREEGLTECVNRMS